MKKHVYVTAPVSPKVQKWTEEYLGDVAEVHFFEGKEGHDKYLPIADALIAIAPEGASKEMLDKAPNCVYIAKYAAGFDDVDLAEATRRGIPVGTVSGTNARSVAEYALTMILCLYKQMVKAHNGLAQEGKWLKTVLRDDCYELTGKTVGIIGMGNIGRNLATLLQGFSCTILYYDVFQQPAEKEKELGVRFCELDELLTQSDVVSIHCALTAETRNLIAKRELLMMKPKAILVNAARGPIVNEEDLVEVLKTGHLLGVGIDAWTTEPATKDNPLCQFDNVLVSPHNAGGTVEALAKNVGYSCINIHSMLAEGKLTAPLNLVQIRNPEVLPGLLK